MVSWFQPIYNQYLIQGCWGSRGPFYSSQCLPESFLKLYLFIVILGGDVFAWVSRCTVDGREQLYGGRHLVFGSWEQLPVIQSLSHMTRQSSDSATLPPPPAPFSWVLEVRDGPMKVSHDLPFREPEQVTLSPGQLGSCFVSCLHG